MKQRIGRYETIEEIGLGGFSRVYKAQDTSLDRLVAIKVMHPVLMSDAGFVTRFQREAKVVAKLQHPNIIPIYDYGEHEGRLFLVMKLMEGSLATRLEKKGPISWGQIVLLTQQAAAGLDFAHQQGVIHRDIKPDNVLLDENGNAVLADFGVVKAMEKSTLTISMSGGILGTPAYIAPEVWNDEQITPAVDVYAFGCVLYEMVTGNKFFEASTPPATMAMHFQELRFPSKWPDGVPPGLSDLLSCALAQDPNERFQTAGELAQSLTTLELDPLSEQYSSLLTALTRKKWQDAIALAEAILAADATYKDASVLLGKATEEYLNSQSAVQAVQWRDQAEQAVEAENWDMALTAIRRWQQIAPGDLNAEQLLAQVKTAQSKASTLTSKSKALTESKKGKQTLPSWLWYAIGIVAIILLIFVGGEVFGNGSVPQTVAQTPTNSAISVLENKTPSKTPTVTATSISTPQPTNTIKPTATLTLIPRPSETPTITVPATQLPENSISPSFVTRWQLNSGQLHGVACTVDGKYFASTDSRYLFDIGQLSQIRFAQDYVSGDGVAFSPNGRYVAFGTFSGDIYLIQMDNGETERIFAGHTDYIRGLNFSPDSSKLASAANDSTIRLWDVATGEQLQTLTDGSIPYSVAFHPNGEIIATTPHGPPDGSAGYTTKIWDVNDGSLINELDDLAFSVAFSTDGSTLATGLYSGEVAIYTTDTWAKLFTLKGGGTEWVSQVAFSPDDSLIAAAASGDNVAKIWDLNTRELLYIFDGHSDFVSGVAFCPNGNDFATSSWDGSVQLWNLNNNRDASLGEKNIWVFDNADSDFTTPPFEDTLTLINDQGNIEQTITGFNFAQTVGGARVISTSPDGSYVLVTENISGKLSRFESTGEMLWSIVPPLQNVKYEGVDIPGNGYAYALTNSGTIYGRSIIQLDPLTGTVIKEANLGGYDLVIDLQREVIWLVGADIKNLTLDLELRWEIDPIEWVALSVDFNSDGSIWVAEGEHPNVQGSQDNILKISPEGDIIESIELASRPLSIRVDRANDNVWVASSPIIKFDSNGNEILRMTYSGTSLAIDNQDESIWIAGPTGVMHFSSDGVMLSKMDGFSSDYQKYIDLP